MSLCVYMRHGYRRETKRRARWISLVSKKPMQWSWILKESDESKKKQRGSRVCSRGHWRVSEDSQLAELVSVHGPQNWNHIAEKMQGRTGKKTSILV